MMDSREQVSPVTVVVSVPHKLSTVQRVPQCIRQANIASVESTITGLAVITKSAITARPVARRKGFQSGQAILCYEGM